MVQNGDGAKKIWGTEAGAPTGSNVGPCGSIGTSVTEAQQAQFVADYFTGWHKDFGELHRTVDLVPDPRQRHGLRPTTTTTSGSCTVTGPRSRPTARSSG